MLPLHQGLVGLGLLFAFTALGEGMARLLHLPLPGSVIGLALLWASLSARVIKLSWIERAADALLSVLGLLFVPAGVGLMAYLDLWRAWPVWFAIVALGVLVGATLSARLASRLEHR
ncbi:CidA/LrgA family protein [Deinococcus peraridilitoris]|uniref:Putative effector of murein hydrolase LrgA n=1 Tax=Deinococcus peraridilitoris (strain DSM 19664 / LMG 22246 / CIP 109416 / KR-200) TaxID=937777 RepID=L0A4E1_DEIPD|nr:CidA/LrgA family protein [Deinococcus peraridilitoris]AFZ68706.1 putative effector of murein hydrolase LrgA [Deinococcus peraridilitoris DSM 19664]